MKDVPSPGIEGFSVGMLTPPSGLSYNPAFLKVVGNDVNQLLAANPGSSVQNFTPDNPPPPDTDGYFHPSAYDWQPDPPVPGHSETGSGVLARITFQAIAPGTSQLTLTTVKLMDPDGNAIGDTSYPFDRIFDGQIFNAEIRIGEPCPTVTPTPTPTRTPTPGPPVGGIAELPALAETSAGEAGVPAEGSGWSAGGYAALVGGVTAAAAAAAGGVWYARRRRAR